MQTGLTKNRWFGFASFFALLLVVVSGCQTWHAAAIPGAKIKQQDVREALRQAEHDPFPSPSDVGMTTEMNTE